MSKISFIWPWVGLKASNILNMGPGDGLGSTRYSPPRHPSHPIPRVHPSPALPAVYRVPHLPYTEVKEAVGLISVAQLSLSVPFSGFRTITEVYNLLEIGRINNHLFIPGFK